ncbi:MAG: hypothetical protein P1V20_30560 [Verrucomicrobiales bacterium]|nr:hypothetical protein [Verrucomicrobiales bacterium]
MIRAGLGAVETGNWGILQKPSFALCPIRSADPAGPGVLPVAAAHFTGSALPALAEMLAVGFKDLVDKSSTAKNSAGGQVADPAAQLFRETDTAFLRRYFLHLFPAEAFASRLTPFRIGGNLFAFLILPPAAQSFSPAFHNIF